MHNIKTFFQSLKQLVKDNQSGSVMILTIITMLVLTYSSLSLVQVHSGSLSGAANHMQKTQAQKISLAAIEFATTQISEGQNPSTYGNKPIGNGKMEVIANPVAGLLDVKGQVSKARSKYTVKTDFAKDCVQFFDSHVFNFEDNTGEIKNILFKKTCLSKFIIEKMTISWTNSLLSQKAMKIIMNTDVYYDGFINPPTGEPQGGVNSGEVIDNNNIAIGDGEIYKFNAIKFGSVNNFV